MSGDVRDLRPEHLRQHRVVLLLVGVEEVPSVADARVVGVEAVNDLQGGRDD